MEKFDQNRLLCAKQGKRKYLGSSDTAARIWQYFQIRGTFEWFLFLERAQGIGGKKNCGWKDLNEKDKAEKHLSEENYNISHNKYLKYWEYEYGKDENGNLLEPMEKCIIDVPCTSIFDVAYSVYL